MSEKKFQIGWYILPEDREFTNTFEFAAWYERVLVPAGRYPAYATKMQGSDVDGFIYVYMDGTITSDYFAAHYCGVPISNYDCEKNKGKEGSHTMYAYAYSVAESILSDSPEWELLPGFTAYVKTTETEEWGTITTNEIRREVKACTKKGVEK